MRMELRFFYKRGLVNLLLHEQQCVSTWTGINHKFFELIISDTLTGQESQLLSKRVPGRHSLQTSVGMQLFAKPAIQGINVFKFVWLEK